MRSPALIIGVILLIIGGLISAGVFSFASEKQVAKLGPLEITSTEQKKPPLNLGYILLGIGAIVVVAGAIAKK
jgi:hypothetical protein